MQGTVQPSTGSRFKGVTRRVPKVFISKCDLSTEPGDIIDHLKESGLKSVSNVELANSTRPQVRPPRSKSFIITLDKFEDYRNLLSGAYTPVGSEVKRYWQPREPSDDVSPLATFNKQIKDLELLESAVLSVASVNSTVYPATHTDVTRNISHTVENMITAEDSTASQQEQQGNKSRTSIEQ